MVCQLLHSSDSPSRATADKHWHLGVGPTAVVLTVLATLAVGCDRTHEVPSRQDEETTTSRTASNAESSSSTSDAPPSDDASTAPHATSTTPPESFDGPTVPERGGPHAPSLAEPAEGTPTGDVSNSEVLMQTDRCASCHAEIVDEWRDSMHAFASFNNPFYRVAFDRYVESQGRERGKFCAGCHDPVPLFEGRIGDPIEPDMASAHAGVTCNVCHGIREPTTDGNASYELTTSKVPVPESGDPEAIERHRERVSTRDEEALCASCHRGFLSPATGHDVFIFGFDEYRPWRKSGWSGSRATRVDQPVANQSCTDCHMPETGSGEEAHRSHRFPGGHTTFAEMIEAPEQLEAVRRLIESAATLDIAAGGTGETRMPEPPEQFDLESGERLWFDVVARNVAGGHRLPGGQRDLRDTWIEVVVEDAGGETVASAGTKHGETGRDPTAHRLRALLLTSRADTEQTHQVSHFRTKAYDHTIPPRDAELVRYDWTPPESVEFPLTVRARLEHRRLTESFQSDVCEATQTERGRAFLDRTERLLGRRPDPCLDQPITTMATDTATISRKAFEPTPDKPEWKRWFDRGLALQSRLSENLDEALDSFERARRAIEASDLPEDKRKHYRAMARVGEAQVMARQRRHREAIEAFDEAESLIGSHPSISMGRGRAYGNVWKFDEAVEEYERASRANPGDERVWRRLAIGRGSLGQYREALMASQKGLAIEPRDADLLRSQMIALRHLDVPESWIERASRAFERYKPDTEAPHLQAECADRSEVCERERLPVHTHELRTR